MKEAKIPHFPKSTPLQDGHTKRLPNSEGTSRLNRFPLKNFNPASNLPFGMKEIFMKIPSFWITIRRKFLHHIIRGFFEIIALLMSLEMSGKGPMKDVGSNLRWYYGLKLICNRAGLPALRVI